MNESGGGGGGWRFEGGEEEWKGVVSMGRLICGSIRGDGGKSCCGWFIICRHDVGEGALEYVVQGEEKEM